MTRPRKASRPVIPAPIPPSERAIKALEAAHGALTRARQALLLAGRTWEAAHLQTTINDLDYRHLAWASLTACTACHGFRDGTVYERPTKCVHVKDGEQ